MVGRGSEFNKRIPVVFVIAFLVVVILLCLIS